MDAKELDGITQRLDVIIRLIALTAGSNLTLTERIHQLARAGIRPTQIAEILNTTRNVVNVRLSEARSQKKRGGN